MRAPWRSFTDRADRDGWPTARLLAALASHEVADRERLRLERHWAEAKLPPGKTLETFDFTQAHASGGDQNRPDLDRLDDHPALRSAAVTRLSSLWSTPSFWVISSSVGSSRNASRFRIFSFEDLVGTPRLLRRCGRGRDQRPWQCCGVAALAPPCERLGP